MEKVIYLENHKDTEENIINLYNDAGWSNYTKDTKSLFDGINNSLYTVSCYDGDKLVGFIRVVGDGNTIVYIQDILVLKDYQKKGVGSVIFQKVLNKYMDVRQIVLITDNDKKTHEFYEKNGMVIFNDVGIVGFTKK